MKTADFITVAKGLLPRLPGFAVKGQLLFKRPIGHTVRGIFLDRSINPRAFYAQVFVQPLFVPAEHLQFNIGSRLGGDCHSWNADELELSEELHNAIKQEAVPFLSRVDFPQDVATIAMSLGKPADPYVLQAVAYSFARGGEVEQSLDALDQLVQLFERKVSALYPWQHEMLRNAQRLKLELQDASSSVLRKLEGYETETATKLGLKKYR